MSLINTIALPLFVFGIVVALIIFVGCHAYRVISDARTRRLQASRDARLEREKTALIASLVVEADNCNISLTPELSEELTKLFYKLDSQKELSRW